ncbi:MAG: glycosyltransferase family 4 protein [Acidimicrobiales bacterium]
MSFRSRPFRVAIDVTPLMLFRTGIGLSTQGLWASLRSLPGGPELVPYALGWRTPATLPELGAPLTSVRLPTRALLACWSRSNVVSLDRWLGDADVVHATNFVVGPSSRATLVTVNDVSFVLDPENTNPVTRTFAPMLRRALARGASVHVTTHHVAAEVDQVFGPGLVEAGRVGVVAYGVPELGPPGPLGPALASRLGGRPYVLAIGSHEPRKNLPRLVRGFAPVAAQHPELCLVLAGAEGPDTGAVTSAIAALPGVVGRRVIVAGAVSAGARSSLLAGATALAYPSLYEGFGFPPLEAMTAGVPVLAGSAGALPEVLGSAAELVDPTNEAEIAGALARVVGDEARRREVAEAGRRRAGRYTWDATARGLDALYRSLASSGYADSHTSR